MPKFSDKTLQKRFPCEYCSSRFRTRQGLSGHIQFKHHAKHGAQETMPSIIDKLIDKLPNLKMWQDTCDLPKSTTTAMIRPLLNWPHVEFFFSVLDIELTKQDFKAYLLACLAQALQGRSQQV